MKLNELPEGASFLDVDGIPVVVLPDAKCIAFTPKGSDESRDYPNAGKAGHDGGPMSQEDFSSWLSSGVSPFDVRARALQTLDVTMIATHETRRRARRG